MTLQLTGYRVSGAYFVNCGSGEGLEGLQTETGRESPRPVQDSDFSRWNREIKNISNYTVEKIILNRDVTNLLTPYCT